LSARKGDSKKPVSGEHVLERRSYLLRVFGLRLRLGMPPEQMDLGDVGPSTEPDFDLVECFAETGRCRIIPTCRERAVIGKALAAFVTTLDRAARSPISSSVQSDFALAKPVEARSRPVLSRLPLSSPATPLDPATRTPPGEDG
jgi:Rrf2 family nitric oxide-sensitive transcriptional repressor